jgi:hypothetical protein
MIFVSHTHADKPLVEQVALRLAAAFGRDKVFYDSWSIQPGEGIIDKMSQALGAVTHFFFFVSENSLKSKMVSLEWQNALLKATRGNCRLVAVRCDSSELPPIMSQSLYIDLYTVGLDAATAQMADVVRGESTYRPPAQSFSNLAFTVVGTGQELILEIKAKFYLEPIGAFIVLLDNSASEFNLKPINEDPYKGGFKENVRLDSGIVTNGFLVSIFRGLTPPMPLRVSVNATGSAPLRIRGVLHQKSHEQWEIVPPEALLVRFAAFGVGAGSGGQI